MNFMSGRPGFYQEMTAPRLSSSASAFQPLESPPIHVIDDDSETNRRGGEGGSSSNSSVAREHMFDKVVTPSDVGKLNRLVIPKQHAEKYFPLDSSTNEKGLLLNFEDRNGKPWRFRYSYWNSSQSYVMTKGWSRFVKEKRLDAGDIVSFQRGVGELGKDRLFIDWRRRPDAPEIQPPFYSFSISNHHQFPGLQRPMHPWSPLFLPSNTNQNHVLSASPNHHHHHRAAAAAYGGYGYNSVMSGNPCSVGSIFYLRSGGGGYAAGVSPQGQRGVEPMVFESVPVVQGKAAAKRLRLFGVNVDCSISESDDYDMMSSSTSPTTATLPLIHQFPATNLDSSPSSSSAPSDLQLRSGYGHSRDDDKGKGSMSLDLDI